MSRFFLAIFLSCVLTFPLMAQPQVPKAFECFDTDLPQFPGGMQALKIFLAKNIHYPKKAQVDNIEGRVVVKMIIRKNGKIDSAQVVRSVRNDIDAEALRVVRMMPKWTPVKDKKNRKDIWYILPISFKLE